MEFKGFKMDGLGNDFVIIDQRSVDIKLSQKQIIKICDRNFIGCDQLIFIKKNKNYIAELEFYNSDGSKIGACGNGTRCVAYFLSKESNKKDIEVLTSSGNLKSIIIEDKLVKTNIGIASIEWNKIPISKKINTKNLNIKILDINNKETVGGTAVNVGNPHVIFFVEEIENFDLKKIGPTIENHNLFPERCNVTLAKKINDNLIKVKVWERGAGLTKACGTAACATAFAAKINNLIQENVEIEFSTGKLFISIDPNNSINMKGSVSDIKQIDINI